MTIIPRACYADNNKDSEHYADQFNHLWGTAMHVRSVLLGIFFLFTVAGEINAASFDCEKASSEVEKTICSDDELSKLDETLNKVYLQALKRTDIKEQTIESQKQWLKKVRDACQDADCLKEAYENRIWELSPSSHDDYRWVEDPDPEVYQEIIPVDPKICRCYEENLRYFAKRNTPMSCERPIAPHLKDRIKEVEWEDLDPDQYPDLFRSIATSGYLPDTSEDIIERDLKDIRAGIADKIRVFRRAKLSLVGRTQVPEYTAEPEPYWIVQYGPNDISPNNPYEPWRCESQRGGGIRSNLNLYVVSEARHELTNQLSVSRSRPSSEGQHLRIIDNQLFVENIRLGAWIELNEVDTAVPSGDTMCVFQFKRSK
jgi:uncharacterized protein YecT (DUF1311 family)